MRYYNMIVDILFEIKTLGNRIVKIKCHIVMNYEDQNPRL